MGKQNVMNNLKRLAFINLLWRFLNLVLIRGSSILVTIALAWFLVPEDFGLIAMLSIFIALSYVLINGGLASSIIRKKELKDIDLSTAFITNISLSIIAYTILYFSAPFIAKFYEQPSLIELIRIVSIAIIIEAFSVVQRAKLRRNLEFKKMLIASTPAVVISGVIAVLLAKLGYGVLAIVYQIILVAFIRTILFWFYGNWHLSLKFSYQALIEMFRFGGFIFADNFLKQLFEKSYVIVIAKFFTLQTTGLYFFAEKIKELFVKHLIQALTEVAFPAFSKIQDNIPRIKSAFRQAIVLTSFILFLMLAIFILLIEAAFELFLPKDWSGAVPMLQLMVATSIFYPLINLAKSVVMALGQSKNIFYIGVYEKIYITILLLLTLDYGIQAIIIGQIIATFLTFLHFSHLLKININYHYKEQLKDIIPSLLLASLSLIAVHYLINVFSLNSVAVIFIALLTTTLLYLATSFALGLKEIKALSELFRKLLHKNDAISS